MPTSKKLLIVFGLVALFGVLLFGKLSGKKDNTAGSVSGEARSAIVYKSPTCGCCVGFIGFLKKDGYGVEIEETTDMDSIKKEHNIPSSMQSCHTSLIGDYFVEGHMPLEVIDKLLAEKPDLDGIALPGMPAGSPGMPGLKTEEFIIYGIKDGEVSEFMRI